MNALYFLTQRPDYRSILDRIEWFWGVALVILVGAMALSAAAHAILNKREVRAAIGWSGVILLVPLLGSILYFLFGINRIQRRATNLLQGRQRMASPHPIRPVENLELLEKLKGDSALLSLYRLVNRVSHRPLTSGNHITPLLQGDVAYPQMLAAIENAQSSVSLCTYIFDDDPVGEQFYQALLRAHTRGVEVRILIDAVGARYSFPPIHQQMARSGLNLAVFMPTRLPLRLAYANLRNHRKILVVDGRIGFTGGMNIREGHLLSSDTQHPVQDLHFRLEGPVVAHLQETFCEDWCYATGDSLQGPLWFPALPAAGTMACRGLNDGPDEDFEHIRWTILGALSAARHSIHIVTPYFLPDSVLTSMLGVAAMRGVDVEILVPAENNLSLVQWASEAHLEQLLAKGCKIYKTSPPFDHTKLMIVDGLWLMMGSANWDPRSLRLNFEFNVECYDSELAHTLDTLFREKQTQATPVTLQDVRQQPLHIRLRNGFARLLSPYL